MTEELTDKHLMEQYRTTGDATYFATLHDRHRDAVLTTVTFVLKGDANLAEDAVQLAFLKLSQHPSLYNPEYEFLPWFKQVAINKGIDARRALRKEGPGMPFTDTFTDKTQTQLCHDADLVRHLPNDPEAPESTDSLEIQERRAALESAIGTLSARDQQLVRLYHLEGISTKDIAAQLGITSDAAYVAIYRARSKMRAQMELLGYDSEAA